MQQNKKTPLKSKQPSESKLYTADQEKNAEINRLPMVKILTPLGSPKIFTTPKKFFTWYTVKKIMYKQMLYIIFK